MTITETNLDQIILLIKTKESKVTVLSCFSDSKRAKAGLKIINK